MAITVKDKDGQEYEPTAMLRIVNGCLFQMWVRHYRIAVPQTQQEAFWQPVDCFVIDATGMLRPVDAPADMPAVN